MKKLLEVKAPWSDESEHHEETYWLRIPFGPKFVLVEIGRDTRPFGVRIKPAFSWLYGKFRFWKKK